MAFTNRVIDLVYQPIRHDDGTISGILVQARDVTDVRAEEARQHMLSYELGHRLKNQLAMVLAIASQTLRNAPDLVTARHRLSERIAVLSAANDAILQGGRGATNVLSLVEQMIAIYDDPEHPRIEISGPRLKIGSRPSLSLSLILHELATNAFKHGALSVPEGKVNLRWRVAGPDSDRFEMIWAETGGPKAIEPQSQGTGMRLISAGLNGTAESKVNFIFEPNGLSCVIHADLAGFQQEH